MTARKGGYYSETPETYEDAIKLKEWRDAINVELEMLTEMNTWEEARIE